MRRHLLKLYARIKLRAYGSEFNKFAKQYFDPHIYLSHNSDVASAAFDAFTHWVIYGIREERNFSSEVFIKFITLETRRDCKLTYIKCGRNLLEIHYRRGLPSAVLSQLISLGKHDPTIFGPGVFALPNLPTHLAGKPDIDLDRLFACIDFRPRAVLIIPLLVIGGGEKYSADIYRVLSSRGVGPIVVIVTDQTEKEAAGWNDSSIVEPFRNAKILFWRDICSNHSDSKLLAYLLAYLEPELMIVTYSGICLQAVARFGKRLSEKSKIFCTYFSLGTRGLGAPYGVTFARQTMRFAVSITDNQATAAILNHRFESLGKPAAVIPPCVQVVSHSVFERRLSNRIFEIGHGVGAGWVWVSRLDKGKGLNVLRMLAMLRSKDTFDLYGPLFSSLDDLGLALPNIRYRGVIKNVLASDFSKYQGYLFTSPIEGMPNIVLEMSQHAIPLIISDAGGLRETFNDDSAIIISVSESLPANAQAFHAACDRLNGMSSAAKMAMVTKAYEAVSARHSPDHYEPVVCKVLEI